MRLAKKGARIRVERFKVDIWNFVMRSRIPIAVGIRDDPASILNEKLIIKIPN
jgi:hypothetical protein